MKLSNKEKLYYHVYNRGVEKRKLFLDESDYFRFIHDMYEFNDSAPANPNNRRIVGGTTSNNSKKREMIVEIVCYCLMPNHFHLILCELKEGGVSYFMKKLGTGYAMYFNEKYDRVGSLFQGRYKSNLIETDEYLKHLSRYIHLNPVELTEGQWKVKGLKDQNKTKRFIESYRWSSYLDYIGKTNFPSVISTDFLSGYFDSAKDYQNFVRAFEKDELILNSALLID